MADYGIKIALPGYDVKKATPEQCALHSGFACPKIKLNQTPAHFGILTQTWTSAPPEGAITTIFTVNHNLGYIPAHFVVMQADDGTQAMLPESYGDSFSIGSFCDIANMTIYVSRDVAGSDPTGLTWIFKYYIFVENGA